jgi:hypothetical protein
MLLAASPLSEDAIQPRSTGNEVVQPDSAAQPGWNPESELRAREAAQNPATGSVASPYPVYQPTLEAPLPQQE